MEEPKHIDYYLYFESHHTTHMREKCGETSPWQGQRDHWHTGQEVDHLARVHKPPTQETDASSGDEGQEKLKGRLVVIQWNLTITDTIGNQNFVHYSEVSLNQEFPVYFR